MTDRLFELIAPALAERFSVERLLGRGGMGAVYLAADLAHGRPLALKILDPTFGAAIGADRFAREVQLTARLQHPHICALYDSGEIRSPDGSVYLWFTMPFLAGGSLADRIGRDGPLAIDDALRIAGEAATGLAFAHRQGVLHRDVKPGNILLSEDGHVQVADFGIARAIASDAGGPEPERLTQTGLALGTPAYMSPEQAVGQRSIDARTDVYALGAVLYEMLAGKPPHTGATAQAIIARQLTEAPAQSPGGGAGSRPVRAFRTRAKSGGPNRRHGCVQGCAERCLVRLGRSLSVATGASKDGKQGHLKARGPPCRGLRYRDSHRRVGQRRLASSFSD